MSRPFSRPLAVVTERAVALANRLPPPDLLRAGDEVESFLRVAGHAVEDEPEQPAGVGLVLVAGDVVQHPLHHLQLVQRQQRHAMRERVGPLGELVVGHALEDHPGRGRLCRRSARRR